MPKSRAVKTALAPKGKAPKPLLAGLFVFLILLLSWSVLPVYTSVNNCRQAYQNDGTLRLSNSIFAINYARTTNELERGLSGTNCIDNRTVKLFEFASPGKYCFWMKDMNYSIDIVWLDMFKKIVTIKKDVSPRSYPETFCPSQPGRYVLELKAGVAEKLQLAIGGAALF